MTPPRLPLLLLLLASVALCWLPWPRYREVAVTGRLSCIGRDGKQAPLSNATVTLWEEDRSFNSLSDSHDFESSSTTDAQGRFSLVPVRFFITVDAPCGSPLEKAWMGACMDEKFIEHCTYLRSYDAQPVKFSNLFEYNMGSPITVKDKYDLDCAFGHKSKEHGTFVGLSCSGGLCDRGRCNYEMPLK